jgi:hypothetical protein
VLVVERYFCTAALRGAIKQKQIVSVGIPQIRADTISREQFWRDDASIDGAFFSRWQPIDAPNGKGERLLISRWLG